MRSLWTLGLWVCVCAQGFCAEPGGSDWPHFLGPAGDGVSSEKNIRTNWPKNGLPNLWTKKVGSGYSAPSVLGNRLVLHHRVKNEELVECFDAAGGKPIWKHSYETNYRDPYGYSNGPRCSPVLTKDHCFTYGAEGRVCCLDFKTGKPVWELEVNKKFKIPELFFGIACSPILEGDLLILLVGGQPDAGVVAVHRKTGKIVWSAVGKKTWDGSKTGWERKKVYKWTGREQIVSYSSPIAATFHGKRHLLCLMRHGLVSLDPKTGAERFKYWFRSPKYESVNAARPVIIGNRVLLTATYGVGSALLEIGKDGKSYKQVWRNETNLDSHWATPIVAGKFVYGFAGRHEGEATFRCIDLKDGSVKWKTNGWAGNMDDLSVDRSTGEIIDARTKKSIPFPFYGRGSIVRCGNHFILLAERGTLALVKIDPTKWTEVARYRGPEMNWPVWTAPIICRGRMYLRDENSLVCVDLREKNPEE